jgi:hypothetical protein
MGRWVAVVSATALALLLMAGVRLVSDARQAAKCEMTYMYSGYVPVPMEEGVAGRAGGDRRASARYELYLYREDGFSKQSG